MSTPEKASMREACSTSYRCVCMSSQAVSSIRESAHPGNSFHHSQKLPIETTVWLSALAMRPNKHALNKQQASRNRSA